MATTHRVDLDHRVAMVEIRTTLIPAAGMNSYVDRRLSTKVDALCQQIMEKFIGGADMCELAVSAPDELKALQVILVPLGYSVHEVSSLGLVLVKRIQ